MPLKKRLQKIGRTSKGIILSQDVLAQLHLGQEDGEHVVLEILGDTLLVRRDGAPPPDPMRVLLALETLGNTIELSDEYKAQPDELLSEAKQQLFQALRDEGPLTAPAITQRLSVSYRQTLNLLRDGVEAGHLLTEGEKYRLNPEAFQ